MDVQVRRFTTKPSGLAVIWDYRIKIMIVIKMMIVLPLHESFPTLDESIGTPYVVHQISACISTK